MPAPKDPFKQSAAPQQQPAQQAPPSDQLKQMVQQYAQKGSSFSPASLWDSLSNGILGLKVPFSGGGTVGGAYDALNSGMNKLYDAAMGNKSSSDTSSQGSTTTNTNNTNTTNTNTQQNNPGDALTMGLGMFAQQYLMPLMNQMNAQNNQLNQAWGADMQNALKQPLPPGVKEIMSATAPTEQLLSGLQNRSGMQMAATAPWLNAFNQQLSQTLRRNSLWLTLS